MKGKQTSEMSIRNIEVKKILNAMVSQYLPSTSIIYGIKMRHTKKIQETVI
jgi:hypothetical protein